MKNLFLLSAASLCGLAQAHDGHGLGGSHWHASDALGFVAVVVVVAAVWWASRK
jgi:Co/Zn/Cd efflux system component